VSKSLRPRREWACRRAAEQRDPGKTVSVLISFSGATSSPQRSFPGVGYLVQDVLHARGLR
jgi:hypothetical protein